MISMNGCVAFNLYNGSGNILKTIFYKADGDLFTVIHNNVSKTRKVVENREFTYKIQKTQIKAITGMKGFLGFVERANAPECWNSHVYYLLEKMVQN